MNDPAATLRAAAEVFVPGLPHDPTPGAADISAELFIEHYLEYVTPGLTAAVVQLLASTAAERFDGATFGDLTLEQRADVLETLAEHPVEQLREVPSLIGILAVAAVYGEWTGQDEDGAVVRRPLGWDLSGFDGPVRGRPHLLREP